LFNLYFCHRSLDEQGALVKENWNGKKRNAYRKTCFSAILDYPRTEPGHQWQEACDYMLALWNGL
jgi:hypothetical protein